MKNNNTTRQKLQRTFRAEEIYYCTNMKFTSYDISVTIAAMATAAVVMAGIFVFMTEDTVFAAPLDVFDEEGSKPLGLGPFRSIDGTDRDDLLGSTNTLFSRLFERSDVDILRIHEAEEDPSVKSSFPNPRIISNALSKIENGDGVLSARGLSDIAWTFGQFLDHDFSITSHGNDQVLQSIPEVPDDFLVEQGCSHMLFSRSTSQNGEQTNGITAFIDGSNIYGSTQDRSNALRTFNDGLLKTSDGDLLPFNDDGLENAGGRGDHLFVAGDIRSNEQISLTAFHVIFVREHNRLARLLSQRGMFKKFNSVEKDELLYQLVRKIVGAELQAITYNEFLPALMGEDRAPRPGDYVYNSTTDPRISTEFATAFFRFGHSMLSSTFSLPEYDLNISQAFFNTTFFTEGDKSNIDSLVRSLITTASQEVDSMLIDDVRNLLFSPDGRSTVCLDLAASNIFRGRDHQIARYNDAREGYGLPRAKSFADINPGLVKKFESVYGSVDDVDLWVGAISEVHELDSSFGTLLNTAFQEQFVRTRDGDPYFFADDDLLRHPLLKGLWNDQVTLGQIIADNTNIHEAKHINVFFATPINGRSTKKNVDL